MMNKIRMIQTTGLMLCMTLGIAVHGIAGDGMAGMPGAFLHAGVGARALGMGKACTAWIDDATAIYWNPAGYAQQDQFQLYFMHSQLFMDTKFDYFAAIAPTQQFGNIGFGLVALSSDEFEQRNVLNEAVGSFRMTDMAFLLSWSKPIRYGVSLGVNYKLVTQKILNTSGIGHGFDVGVRHRLFNRVDAGISITNLLAPKVKLVQLAQKYPMQIRAGVAVPLLNNQLLLSVDAGQIIGWGKMTINFGAEYRPVNRLALRTGFADGLFTFGFGFSLRDYGVDYSSSSVDELGMNHRFAVRYTFGGFGVNAVATPDVFSPTGEINLSHLQLQAKSRSPIVRWEFDILDVKGKVIRHFASEGTIPEELVWDGRDNRGVLVEDGRFNYRFVVMTTDSKMMTAEGGLVTIDTSGPDGSLGFSDIQ